MRKIKTLNVLRSVISLPIFIVLLAMLIAGSVALGVLTTFLDSSNTKNWIEDTGIYDEAPNLIITLANSRINEFRDGQDVDGFEFIENYTNKEEFRNEVKKIFPPDWIRDTVEGVIDAAYESINSPGTASPIIVDLSDREEKIRVLLSDIFTAKVDSLPDCNTSVEGDLEKFDLIRSDCLPKDISESEISAQISQQVNLIIPKENTKLGEIYIGGQGSLDSKVGSGDVKNLVDRLPLALGIFIILATLLHLALYLLFPGHRGKFIIFSFLWIITAVILIILTVAMFVGFDFAYQSYVGPNIPPETAIVAPFAEKILMAIRDSIAWKLGLIGLIFAFLGAMMGYKINRQSKV